MVRPRSPRRAAASRRSGIFIAILLVGSWAASAWWPEPRMPDAGDVRPPRAGLPRPPSTFEVSPPAAAERGELGFPMLLAQVVADPRLSVAGAVAGPGMNAAALRELYEGDAGEAARFMFARRLPPAGGGAP